MILNPNKALLRCHRRILAMIFGSIFSGTFDGSSHTIRSFSVLHLALFPRSVERKISDMSLCTLKWKPLPYNVRWPFFEQLQAWVSFCSSLHAKSPTVPWSWILRAVKHFPVCRFLKERVSGFHCHFWKTKSGLHSSNVNFSLPSPSCNCTHFPVSSFFRFRAATSKRGRNHEAWAITIHNHEILPLGYLM